MGSISRGLWYYLWFFKGCAAVDHFWYCYFVIIDPQTGNIIDGSETVTRRKQSFEYVGWSPSFTRFMIFSLVWFFFLGCRLIFLILSFCYDRFQTGNISYRSKTVTHRKQRLVELYDNNVDSISRDLYDYFSMVSFINSATPQLIISFHATIFAAIDFRQRIWEMTGQKLSRVGSRRFEYIWWWSISSLFLWFPFYKGATN